MSRTDIHRPIWVQELDPLNRHWFKDHHDHTNGECDLAENLLKPWIGPGAHCYRTPWSQSPCLCGCDLCTGRKYDHHRRRRERHQWRKVQGDLMKWKIADLPDAEWWLSTHYAW